MIHTLSLRLAWKQAYSKRMNQTSLTYLGFLSHRYFTVEPTAYTHTTKKIFSLQMLKYTKGNEGKKINKNVTGLNISVSGANGTAYMYE